MSDEHAARARLRDVDRVGGLMQVAGVVERDEQREVLEFQPVDEGKRERFSFIAARSSDTVLRSANPAIGL